MAIRGTMPERTQRTGERLPEALRIIVRRFERDPCHAPGPNGAAQPASTTPSGAGRAGHDRQAVTHGIAQEEVEAVPDRPGRGRHWGAQLGFQDVAREYGAPILLVGSRSTIDSAGDCPGKVQRELIVVPGAARRRPARRPFGVRIPHPFSRVFHVPLFDVTPPEACEKMPVINRSPEGCR